MNGVPLKRVSQAFVISTSKKIDVSKAVKSLEKVPALDELFQAKKERKEKADQFKAEADFFGAAKKAKGETSDERKELQADVDAGVALDAELKAYLKAKFALSKSQRPHTMKF